MHCRPGEGGRSGIEGPASGPPSCLGAVPAISLFSRHRSEEPIGEAGARAEM